jgi:hypothetical protein
MAPVQAANAEPPRPCFRSRVWISESAGARPSFARPAGKRSTAGQARAPTSAGVPAVGDRAMADRGDADDLVVVCQLVDDAIRAHAQ